MDYNDLREVCSLIIKLVDERNDLFEENMYYRECLKKKHKDNMEMYHQNISITANILSTLIKEEDEQRKEG